MVWRDIKNLFTGAPRAIMEDTIFVPELVARIGEIPIDMLASELGAKLIKLAMGGLMSLGGYFLKPAEKTKQWLYEAGSHLMAMAIPADTPEQLRQLRTQLSRFGTSLKVGDIRTAARTLARKPDQIKAALGLRLPAQLRALGGKPLEAITGLKPEPVKAEKVIYGDMW